MFTKSLKFVAIVALVLGVAGVAQAALMTPITLTANSYNQDGIWAATDTGGTTTTGRFGSKWSWFETAAGRSTGGLPSNGTIVSASNTDTTFQLASYIANNVLELNASSASMTLATPGQYSALSFLACSSGQPTLTYTLNFADSTTTQGTFVPGEWNQGASIGAVIPLTLTDRVGTFLGPNTACLFEYDIALSAGDQAKTLNSVTFSMGAVDVLAISGAPVPEPSTLMLLSLGLVSLLAYAWKKRK